jgi:DNA-binding NtrC family response regulator
MAIIDHGEQAATRLVYLDDLGGQTIHLRRCRLIRINAAGDPEVYVFDQPVVRIGALSENDLVIDDDTVSRFHCQILQEEDEYVLRDLSSTNGTFIEGVRIREAFLSPGARIRLGESQLSFEPIDEHIRVEPAPTERYGEIVGRNVRMRQIFHILERISTSAATVIIEGETGTGKEVVARTIHGKSNRAKGPFIVFDCGAVPENLIESELFGHEKGAFTGANRTRKGLFEMANGGTLFLDEMGELSIELQPKLLRVLESREVRPVGSNKSTPVDVRVIAATNRDLAEEVKAARFRQDLYYRLSVVRLHLPSLRERPDDIPLLVQHLLDREQTNRGPQGHPFITDIAAPALRALQAYEWPGNVRELANVIERACSFSNGPIIELDDLPEYISRIAVQAPPGPTAATTAERRVLQDSLEILGVPPDLSEQAFKDAKEAWLATFESEYIESLLKRNDYNISSAARDADIDRKYFRKLMKKYGIEPP